MRPLVAAFLASALLTPASLACVTSAPPAPPASAATASSKTLSTPRALERLFRAPQADANWFAPSLLTQNPMDQMQMVLDVLHDALGDFQGVSGDGYDYVVRFSAGQRDVRAKVDEQGRFVVLLIAPG